MDPKVTGSTPVGHPISIRFGREERVARGTRKRKAPRTLPPLPYPAPEGMTWTRDAKGVPTLRLKTLSETLSRRRPK
jgi:hypothetical protein